MAAKHDARGLPRWRTMMLATLPALAPLEPDALTPVLSLPLHQAFNTRTDWHVTAYQAPGDEGRFGDLPARICFNHPPGDGGQACTPLMRAATNDSGRMVYQTVTGLSVTMLLRAPLPAKAVLAHAEMSYGGSGSSEQYTLWSYRSSSDKFEPLATFATSEQGEFQIIDTGKLAGCVITADYVLGPGETHFGLHRFAIAVHRLNPVTMTFTEVLRYVTLARYPSLDEGGVDVIRPEMPQTLRILKYIYPAEF
jgi:hypothetical protein